jgi:hypothetical protein
LLEQFHGVRTSFVYSNSQTKFVFQVPTKLLVEFFRLLFLNLSRVWKFVCKKLLIHHFVLIQVAFGCKKPLKLLEIGNVLPLKERKWRQ